MTTYGNSVTYGIDQGPRHDLTLKLSNFVYLLISIFLMSRMLDLCIFNALSRFESQTSSYKQDTCTEFKIFDLLKAGVRLLFEYQEQRWRIKTIVRSKLTSIVEF